MKHYLLVLDYLLAELAYQLLARCAAVGAGGYEQAYARLRADAPDPAQEHRGYQPGRYRTGVVGADYHHILLAHCQLLQARRADGVVQRLLDDCGLILAGRIAALASGQDSGEVLNLQAQVQRLFVERQIHFKHVYLSP